MWMPGFILDNLSLVLCSLLLTVGIAAKASRSDLIAMTTWILLGLIMAVVSNEILDLAKSFPGNGYVIWYGSWALFDLMGIYWIYILHKYFGCSAGKLALFISVSFVILASLQGIGYLDRGVLGWKAADEFYRYMILAVNTAIVPMTLWYIWPSVRANLLPRLMTLR